MMLKYSLLIVLLISLCMKSVSASYSCCTPDKWTGSSLSNDEHRRPFQKNYYYNHLTLSVRIDTIFSDGSLNRTTITTYKNLTTTGTEWVIDNLTGECYQTDPDYWNSMCFGAAYGLPHEFSFGDSNVFRNPSNGITVSTDAYCRPLSITNTLTKVLFKFINVQNDFDDSVFNLPEQCH